MKIIEVIWVDSLRGDGKWNWLKDFDFAEYEKRCIHKSTGYLLKETKTYIALADSYQFFEYDDGDVCIGSPLFIPKVAIKKMVTLKK